MDLRPQAGPQAGFEDAGGVLDREESFFAENVHEIGVAGRLRHHPADGGHIVVVAVAAAYGVGAEEGGADQGGGGRLDAVDDAQHFHFVDRVEAVAALDFKGAGSLGDHFVDTLHRLAEEFVFGSLVQQVGGVEDAAAVRRDLLVGEAPDFIEELAVAAAGIDDMGVAVAESRHQQAAFAVDDLVGAARRRLIPAAEPGNPAVLDQQPGVVDRPDLVHRRPFLADDTRRHNASKTTDVAKQPSHHL